MANASVDKVIRLSVTLEDLTPEEGYMLASLLLWKAEPGVKGLIEYVGTINQRTVYLAWATGDCSTSALKAAVHAAGQILKDQDKAAAPTSAPAPARAHPNRISHFLEE